MIFGFDNSIKLILCDGTTLSKMISVGFCCYFFLSRAPRLPPVRNLHAKGLAYILMLMIRLISIAKNNRTHTFYTEDGIPFCLLPSTLLSR